MPKDKKKLSSALRQNLQRRKEMTDYIKQNKIYEGKAKILYSTNDENFLIQYFKDDATAFNNLKKDVIAGKGVLNNAISDYIMIELAKNNIPTHYIKKLNEREQLIKKVKIIPLEVIVRNVTAGSLAKRLGLEEGIKLLAPSFEVSYKKDELGDPLINEDHAINVLKLVDKKQFDELKSLALKINAILQKIFLNIGIKLVDFKIEFGFGENNQIILADEISPDSCRLWDEKTNEKLDKDRFRRDLGGLVEAYQEVAKRLGINI